MASSKFSISSTIKLNNGVTMPRVHLGTYMTHGGHTEKAVANALAAGYRGFDSAEWYGNERNVGKAIRGFLDNDEITRKDIWFTTKLKTNENYDKTRAKIKKSIQESGLEYLDLYLLHSPYGGKKVRLECWKAVEDAIDEGEVRAGGVSNFGVRHLRELLDSKPRIIPAVNQVEVHPFNTQTEITSFCQDHNIVVEAYAPLARAMRMNNRRIVPLTKKYGCDWAQLMIRWSLQKGYVPIPKSTNPKRIVSNTQFEHFNIEEEDIKSMDELDEHLVTDWDPTNAE